MLPVVIIAKYKMPWSSTPAREIPNCNVKLHTKIISSILYVLPDQSFMLFPFTNVISFSVKSEFRTLEKPAIRPTWQKDHHQAVPMRWPSSPPPDRHRSQSEPSDCVVPPTIQRAVCAQQEGTSAAFLWHRMFFLCSEPPPTPRLHLALWPLRWGDEGCVGKV